MRIVLASGNPKKALEVSSFLKPHELMLPQDAGFAWDNPIEHGSTFIENALIKAEYLYAKIGMPVLADDSGLCVDALDGRPGIHSARYGSTTQTGKLSDYERNLLLLDEMKGIQERNCRFVCALVCILDTYRKYIIQETCEGILLETMQGTNGFGYDPLFFIPELAKTMAELTPEEKNKVSHRGKALAQLIKLL